MRAYRNLVGLVLALILVAGCSRGDREDQQRSDAGKPRAERGLVVAKVGDSTITVGQLEDELNRLHSSIRVRFSSPERRKDFLKTLVRFEVLAAEARRRRLQKDPQVIKRAKRAMIDVMMDELRSSLVKMEDITDKDVEAYYNKHIELYKQPPKVRASLIVVKTRAEAMKLMADARKKAGDARYFAELAVKHSIDPASKVRRGDLSFFSKKEGKLPNEIVEAAFAIDAMWTVGGPVQTAQGWAILMKTGEIAARNHPFEMERDRIRNRLYNERRLQKVDQYVKDLQAKAKIEVLDQNLAKVKVKEAPHPPSSLMPHPPHPPH